MTEKTERELIEAARDHLRKAEAEWQKAIIAVRGVVALNMKVGNAKLANEATGAAAQMVSQLGEMMFTHKRVTDVLLEAWPGYDDIVTRGPGR
ncbi:MAG: hypothetical protein ACRC6I_18225 [Paracoccaceae bacterium]